MAALDMSLGDLIETLKSTEGVSDIDLNQPIAGNETPLGQVCFGGSTEYVALMLKHGADPNCMPDPRSLHPLVNAMCGYTGRDDRGKIVELAQLLLDAGMNTSNVAQGNSLLMEAAYYELPELCRFLMEHDADPFFENSEGETALSTAQSAGSQEALATLCDYLDEDITNWMGSARVSLNDILQNFIDPEPGVHSRNGLDHTPLHLVAEMGAYHLIGELQELGADFEALDHRGETPIFKLFNSDLDTDTARDTLDELLLMGARADVTNKEGQTLMDRAGEKPQFQPLVEHLEQHLARTSS